jgi:predicted dehydrogenase
MSHSTQKPVRIGLVGAGAIMRLSHAPVIAKSGIAKVAAVFDVALARAEAITSEFGGNAFDNIEAMLDKAEPAATRYRYDLSQSGGATIIDLTIHRIDIARHLVGDISDVFAEPAHSELPEKVDDNVWLLTRFENGGRGCLSGNRYSPNIGDGTDLFGSEGTIHIASESINPYNVSPLAVYTEKSARDLPDVLREAHYPDAWWKSFEGGWITVKPPRRSPYEAQLKSFCEAVRGEHPAEITGVDGLKAQEVVQAAHLSMQSGRWVHLPLPPGAPFVVPIYS